MPEKIFYRRGFTLIEIAIVLAVIALAIGGVLVGQELLAAARVRGIVKEMTTYQRSIGVFRSKYESLPGDLKHPEKYWVSGYGAAGDGNDIIGWYREGPSAELQLYQAGLLPEAAQFTFNNTYCSDTGSPSQCWSMPGITIPRSKAITGAGWALGAGPKGDYTPGDGIISDSADGKNILLFTTQTSADPKSQGTSALFGCSAVLSSRDTYTLDSKIDDGFPKTGNIRYKRTCTSDYSTYLAGCVDSNNSYDTYLSTGSLACSFYALLSY